MEGSFDEKVTGWVPQLVEVLSVATGMADTWTIILQVRAQHLNCWQVGLSHSGVNIVVFTKHCLRMRT